MEAITDRACQVLGSKRRGDDIEQQLKSLLDMWLKRIETTKQEGSALAYQSKRPGLAAALLQRPGPGTWESYTCLNSLREVEPTVTLVVDKRSLGDEPDV